MTVLEAIKQVLLENPSGLTCRELTDFILDRGLYSFNTANPSNIVNHELRKHCEGLTFPSAHPVKYFTISQASGKGNKAVYQLIDNTAISSEEGTVHSTNHEEMYIDSASSDLLPVEKMAKMYKQHLKETQKQLIGAILDNPPAFFEELVVKLLLKLGYGYNQDAGMVVGKSHDGGIDGIINEDALGLDKIYIQAKRYVTSQSIGRPELQAFAGAMMSGGVNKGVFITTSSFTKAARDFTIQQSEKNISLIDGDMLTRLMIQNEVGVRSIQSYDVYEIDSNFFSLE